MNEEDKNIEKEEIKALLVELISLQKEQLNLSKETYTLVKKVYDYIFDKNRENKDLFREFCFNVLANWFADVLLHEDDKQQFSEKLDKFIKTVSNSL